MTRDHIIAGWSRPRLRVAALLISGLLAGCAKNGAPSLIFAGSYFPWWMACAFIGVAVALALRLVLGRAGLGQRIAFPLAFYVAVALLASTILWLFRFAGPP